MLGPGFLNNIVVGSGSTISPPRSVAGYFTSCSASAANNPGFEFWPITLAETSSSSSCTGLLDCQTADWADSYRFDRLEPGSVAFLGFGIEG